MSSHDVLLTRTKNGATITPPLDISAKHGDAGTAPVTSPRNTLTLLTWLGLSVSLACLNKGLLGYVGFRFPMFMASLHMLGSYIATCAATAHAANSSIKQSLHRLQRSWTFFLPVACLYSVSLCLRNVALIHISIASAQLLVAFAPLFVYAFSVAFGLEAPKLKLLFNVCAIAVGAALCVTGSVAHTTFGLALQLAGVLCETLRGVLLNVFLRKVEPDMTATESLQCLSLPCFALTALSCAFFESGPLAKDLPNRGAPFFCALFANVGVAVLFNFMQLHVLKMFKVLTLSMAGVTKDWVLISASTWVEGGGMSPQFVAGGVLTFGSSMYYAVQRHAK